MEHHEEEAKGPEVNFVTIYYAVGILSFMFIGFILQGDLTWIPILGVFGLLFTAFFRGVFVKGRTNKI